MRQIPIRSSLLTFLDELEFTEAALPAEPLATEFATAFDEEIAGWGDVFQRERAARREVTRGHALVAIRNGLLDATTLRFGDHCFLESGRDRKSVAFRKFFPTSSSEFVNGSLRKQAVAVANRLGKTWADLFFRSASDAGATEDEGGGPVDPTPAPAPTG